MNEKSILMAFNKFFPESFSLVRAPLKLLFSYGVMLYGHISFNALTASNLLR